MEPCKYCGSLLLELQEKGPHLGLYCIQCKKWNAWVKKEDRDNVQRSINANVQNGKVYVDKPKMAVTQQGTSVSIEMQQLPSDVPFVQHKTIVEECKYCCEMGDAITARASSTKSLIVDTKAKELRIKDVTSKIQTSFSINGCPMCLRKF
jgi:phage FluMu protein Com